MNKISRQHNVLICGIMSVLCLLLLPAPVFSAAPTATYLFTISGDLYAPSRIAVDTNGRIYVADPRQDRVQVYYSDGFLKDTVVNFQGTPLGVAVDGSNNLYISDSRSKSVMVFDSNWNFIRKLGGGDGEFGLPSDIAVSNTGRVYVTDSKNNVVKVYSASDGTLVTTFGGYGQTGAGVFNFPTGITVDNASGEVIVADEGDGSSVFGVKGRVQRFSLDGAYIAGFSPKIIPQGVITDGLGRIYIADVFQGLVYVYDNAGTKLSTIGSFGKGGGQLANPLDVVFDNYGNLLITSSNNAQVVVYSIDGSPPPPTHETNPPVTEHSISGAVGNNGWYKSNISIGLSSYDASGISKIEYSFNDATWSECSLSQFHCEPLIDVTTDGTISFYYRATDVVGNVESTKTTTLKIDKTPPTLSAFISPPQNANGWNNTDATVSFTAEDSVSGVAIQPSPSSESFTSEGTFPLTRSATDNAGNTTTLSYEVKIDKTLPTITASSSPSPNANGWNNTDITVSFSGSDSLSGLYAISQTTILTQDGISALIGQAQDFADNIASVNVPYKLDKTGPSITISSPSNNTVTKDNVTLNYSVTDSLAGVQSTEGDASGTVYTAEGVYTKTIKATDEAGNTAQTTVTWTIDKTPPTLTINSPADNTITNKDVTLEYAVTDNLTSTNVVDEAGETVSSGTTAYKEEKTYTKTYTATDEAGNKSAGKTITWTIDKSVPTITITSPSNNLVTKDNVTLNYTVTDSLAGVQSTEGDASGTVYTAEGVYTKTIKATDEAGNTAQTSVTWTIDKTAPEIVISSPSNNLITNSDVTLNYTVTETNSYTITEGDASGTVYKDEGKYTKTIEATDAAGNKSEKKSVTWTIDKSVPTITITSPSNNLVTKDNVTLNYTVTDSLAGVQSTEGDASGTVYTQERTYIQTIKATDEAGNTAQTSVTWTIDKTPPTLTVSASPLPNANGWNNTDVTIKFTATDNLSGVASKTQDILVTESSLVNGTGQAVDYAGNTTAVPYSYDLKIDKTPPVIAISSPSDNLITNSDVTLNYTVTETNSYTITEGDVSGTVYKYDEGKYTKTIKATDKAGNKAQTTVTWTIDKTPPTITITSPVDNAVSGASIKLEYTVQDNLTETSKIKIEGAASGTVYTQERTYIQTIKATDEAGWTTTKTVTFTLIPNTGITVKTSEPIHTYTAPKIPEEKAKAAEPKKEEVKEKAGTASITIRAPKHGLLTKDDVKLEYTVEGAEKIEGDASGTVYTKEDKYTKTITAIDKDGGRTTQKITFTIDKTPPEAIITYDISDLSDPQYGLDKSSPYKKQTYDMDIKVSGTDNITKDVIVTKSETGFSYTLTDEAGNTLLILFEKMDRDADKLAASIGSLIYNGAAIIPNENTISITVNVDKKTGAVKNITQTYRSKNMWKIIADYDKKKNTTKVTTGDDKDIKAKDKKKDKTAASSGSGIKNIKILTKAGELSYGY